MNIEIKKIVEIIKNGGVIAYPTDTLYGLGADIANDSAVKKIISLKKRKDKPFSIACCDICMAEKYAQINKNERRFMSSCLPGPYTFILPKKEGVSDLITSKSKNVGIRIPAYPLLLKIISELGRPIITTSANHSGAKDIKSLDELEIKTDYVIKGECKYKKGSTVVDLRRKKILRRGVLADEICELLKEL